MGRQKGEGARSKARASSSSSAADAVGFGGYVGSSRLDSTFSTEDSNPLLDIDSEVAQHLKRLARKDPITNEITANQMGMWIPFSGECGSHIIPRIKQPSIPLKALASLSALLKQKSGKEIVPIIPQWAFEYKTLLLDYNREVRRATHERMTNLVTAVGKDLAPHLKSLMGLRWFSQFDPSAEVSQPAKRLGMATGRVISSSLLALATLLDVLVSVQIERPGFENISAEPKHASKAKATAISFAEKLFSAHKYFLEFLKSQSPAVRSATYTVLRSYIKNIPQAFDQGNMKTIATAVLGAFQGKNPACHSSMNGCFGSQQVSYPVLVLFLDTIPSKAFSGDKCFLEFFLNLWAGRNPVHSLNADRLAFFRAFREYQDSDQPLHGKTAEMQNIKYSLSYLQELGKCIVEILSGIYSLEENLLSFFCVAFQEALDLHAKQKGESWPLLHLVGPMLAKYFSLVRSLDSVDGVRLLSTSVSIFGARKVTQVIFSSSNAPFCGPPCNKDGEMMLEYFLQIYKEKFVPWCLHGHDSITSARLDLLLELLDDECFYEQWHAIITYAIDLVNFKGSGSIDSNHLASLAMLFEKARNEMRKVGDGSFHRLGSVPDHWHHELLEATAVSVASSLPPFGTSDAQFLCSVLGGATEGNLDSFVSRKSMVLIFKEVLRKLNSFIMDSSFSSVKQAGALFDPEENCLGLASKNPANVVDMACFALGIVEGSFFCLRALDEERGLVSSISAAVFIIDWEYRMAVAREDALDDESRKMIEAQMGICESAHGYLSKISNLWKSFCKDAYGNYKFISLIDKLIYKLGFHKVIVVMMAWTLYHYQPRLQQILRLLLELELLLQYYAHGNGQREVLQPLSYLNLSHLPRSSLQAWPTLGEDMEDIEEPSLRAVASFLFTLLKENIWGPEKAMVLCQLLVDKLFLDTGYCQKLDPEDSKIPTFGHVATGQDMEEWFHLVFSCYPLRAVGRAETMKLDRNIDHEERELLLNLYRKQRHENGRSIDANQLPDGMTNVVKSN
ncbi:HEAT/U-box domain-containing protein, putative isoform 2 [Hibiscus syriacus]|uniref:E3 ubiquitin-protein ligase listerin n=1 Tax=Hibiscus syriacus TaxID=106335 RepID=A0A6A2XK30_HIBSY|nr:HEAT/U-box domain-containing protein, putative isoform 2 [Hibiscus syriacus]